MSCCPGHGNGAEHALEHTDIALLCALQTTTNTHTDNGKGGEETYIIWDMFVAQIIFRRGKDTYGAELLMIDVHSISWSLCIADRAVLSCVIQHEGTCGFKLIEEFYITIQHFDLLFSFWTLMVLQELSQSLSAQRINEEWGTEI